MRSFFVCLTAFLFLISFPACSPAAPRDPFAYAGEAFSVSVRGTYTPAGDTAPRSFSAQISAGAPVGGDPSRRSLTVAFTSPDTLAGVTVTAALTPASDGTYKRSVVFTYPSEYGKVEIPAKGGEFDGFLRFAEALLPLGDVTDVSPVSEDGSYTVTRKGEEREAVFTFAEGQTIPVRVRLTDTRGTVEMAVSGGTK